jgi:hypothetical protein
MDRPSGVRPVPVFQTPEGEDDHVTLLDDPLADLMVGVGSVRPGAHDGEVHLRVTELAQQAGMISGDLRLPATGGPDVDNPLVCPVGRGSRSSQPLDLRRVLDGTQHWEAVSDT